MAVSLRGAGRHPWPTRNGFVKERLVASLETTHDARDTFQLCTVQIVLVPAHPVQILQGQAWKQLAKEKTTMMMMIDRWHMLFLRVPVYSSTTAHDT